MGRPASLLVAGPVAGSDCADQLPWQPSVQALLPFPQVLVMMASDMPWTEELGAAFLESPADVMEASQRMRQAAYNYGYLRSNSQIVVQRGPFIEIAPVDPAFMRRAVLQSSHRLRGAASRRGGRRRRPFWIWRPSWSCIRAVGLGNDTICLG